MSMQKDVTLILSDMRSRWGRFPRKKGDWMLWILTCYHIKLSHWQYAQSILYDARLSRTPDDFSRSEEVRLRAAVELKSWLTSRMHITENETRAIAIQEVLPRVTALMNSNDHTDKLAGLDAIDALIEAIPDASIASRLATHPWHALSSMDPAIMSHATKTFAKLVATGGTLIKGTEVQIGSAYEWLASTEKSDRAEHRRYAAAMLFRELCRTAPLAIVDRVETVMDYLWGAMRDPKVNIREVAAQAMSGCLLIAGTRDTKTRDGCYDMVLEQVIKGFKMNTGDSIHGSLLGYKELFTSANMYMQDRYNEVCDQILTYKDHRENQVRRTVIELIPTMASYSHTDFITHYLHKCMVYLLGQLKKERDRSTSFTAIGHVALAVTNHMTPYLEAILTSVKEGLQARGKKNAPSEASIFSCISMLSTAVGPALTKHMHELLDLMFAYGISEPLVRALVDLSTHIPPLLPTIQERLLNLLCLILSGEPYRQPGAPLQIRPPALSITRDLNTLNVAQEIPDPAIITLAIQTLGDFDFSGTALHEFVRDTVTNYLDDDSRETSNHSINIVTEVLEKLLVCAIADPDPVIRQSTLAALDTKFDRHLAQAENIRSIFLAINDEVYSIRETAIRIVGRISIHNPAYVMPSLRKALIQLLTELEYSTYPKSREDCATLLGLLVGASARLSKPYVLSVLRVLLPKARDSTPQVAAAIMLSLGELAKIGGEDILPRLDDYMSLILEMLHDQASIAKRNAALHTLGLVSSYSGYVIEPYTKYPTLLGTLVNILKTESVQNTRRETVKVLGILGALDPYKQVVRDSMEDDVNDLPINATDPTHPMNIGPGNEEYYPTVAFHALLSILRDSSLSTHHAAVVEAVMYIFGTLRLRCVSFLPQVIPAFLGAMRNSSAGSVTEKYYFENLSKLTKIVGQHIRNHLTPILAIIRDSWSSGPSLQIILVDLVEKIAVALEGEFKVYLPTLLPLMLTCFDQELTDRRLPSLQRILHAFGIFGANLEEYLHLVIPVMVRTFERSDAQFQLRRHAIQVTGVLCRKINFSDHASRVIHPLARVLSTGPAELRNDCMDALCSLVSQIGSDFAIFVPVINKVIVHNRIQHANYDQIVTNLLRGEPLPDLGYIDHVTGGLTEQDPAVDAGVNKLPVNQQQLKTQWDTPERPKADDWRDWMKRLSIALLRASPSMSIRACSGLAEQYPPLARDLFHAAFVSCWNEMYESYQDELVKAIDTALSSPFVPPEITQNLLNLAEFMEHDDKSLPIAPKVLGQYAQKCHAFAKALHYKELEWSSDPTVDTIESLIHINNQLQQPDVAKGLLAYAQSVHHITLREEWYEKLENWDSALAAYVHKQAQDPNNFSLTQGRMRCLHALGDWEQLSELARENWKTATSEQRRSIAPLAAAAAWGLAEWEAMDDYIGVLKHDSPDRAWFRAILSIHRSQFSRAQQHVNRARDLLDTELTTLVGESYNRAYNIIVRIQMLAELEEIISYKESGDNRERRLVIQRTWMKRLKGCQRDVEVWQRILKVRALVVSPRENMPMWIKFANLCRKSGRLGLAEKTLNSLLSEDHEYDQTQSMQGPPHVIYAQVKFGWAKGDKVETLEYLRVFTEKLTQDLGLNPDSEEPNAAAELAATGQLTEYTRLLARCYYKLGEWQSELQPDWGSEYVSGILTSYLFATNLDRKWYKAWHAWALANSEVVNYYTQASANAGNNKPMPNDAYSSHIVPAVKAFFQSIALSPGNSLQDTLRLLTLWFKYGSHGEVAAAISESFSSVSVNIWLEVIPQLIARIHASSSTVRKLIHHVLTDVGKAHPQALVYPLTVASKYPSPPRRRAALAIIDRIAEHSANLVEQAKLVSQELIRVAILWHELWHEGLEEASRLYYGDGNVEAMFATLDPLHDMLEKGPETLREIAFQQQFGRDLQDARESCRRYQTYGEVSDLNQAWDLYYQIFKRLARTLPTFMVLELQQVSPKLLAVHDLELAVPGTYHVGKPIIRIIKFAEAFDVLTSKQRPRKLKCSGSDGKDHAFLLKGHEDLRQDERVMQLFGLVNTLLGKDPETFKRHLMVQPYPIIPLAPNSGLLGWVDNTDTLHVLVKNYRDSRKILLNIEHRIMLQMAPDYDHMALMQKIEVFEYAIDNTTGQDLYRVLWLKSRNSEAWLDRRTNYTRTLATMSMVGHILGLGDRHPSNLLLDRLSGAVVHVDFGDCFEVAMVRDKYPERVPFRLTRMLVQAMEVSGIEGTFRITCEHSMRVIRDNKESIMAVLEAFVHDPLINWRLINQGRRPGGTRNERGNARGGIAETNPMDDEANEALNQKALQVVDRVSQKLTGRDFRPTDSLSVREQVQKLILQATSVENLCQTFVGWCAFW